MALSGGSDSVALFSMLLTLSKTENISFACVHVDHGLRNTSENDALFCHKLCEKYQVPFYLKKVTLHSKSENDARQARYLAFSQVYREWKADVLALAHHSDDQAETVLMHLFRGSGMQGLCGMQESSCLMVDGCPMRLWRPVIHMNHLQLERISDGFGYGWCLDETNRQDQYLRNFLRNNILPQIEERVPKVRQALCRTAQILQDENEVLDSMVQPFLKQHTCFKPPVQWIACSQFDALHKSLKRRVLLHFLPKESSFEHIEAVLSLTDGETVNVPGGYHVRRSGAYLCLYRDVVQQKNIASLYAERAYGRHGDGRHQQALPAELLKKCHMRYRRPGDVIRPFGMKEHRKLQDYLTDKKIPRPMRDHLPLLCMDDCVIWVIGVGAGEEVRCAEGKESLLLTYTDRLPFEI